ncbi:MAG: T9SS type A sorting domain-containing protein [Candidatus Kapabacteria bacterium]|nr:T9SS type A sorting domain-containing protein [Ignavibacteriota bacterium]MCW5883802.1 T9SS type A sorting domain-containing protein [Candidatus Kapabacteria bacterium]
MKYFFIIPIILLIVQLRSSYADWENTCLINNPPETLCFGLGPETILALGDDIFVGGQFGHIYSRSYDNGDNWVKPDEIKGMEKLFFNGKYIFALWVNYPKFPEYDSFYSQDTGKTWQIFTIDGNSIKSMACDSNTAYAYTDSGIYFSEDYGQSWEHSAFVVPGSNFELQYSNQNLLFASPFTFSKDKGMTWESISIPNEIALDIAFSDDYVFVSTGYKLFRTDYSLGKFELVLSYNDSIRAVESYNNNLIVITADKEIHYSHNQGLNWQIISGGIDPLDFESFDRYLSFQNFISNDKYMFLGLGSNIYRYNLKLLSNVQDFQVAEIQIFPNPSDEILYISGNSNSNSDKFCIYDILGNKVLEDVFIGRNSINISHLSSGMYFLSIDSENYKFIKK